jgi:DNA-binding beta-propeller fold protein YncE
MQHQQGVAYAGEGRLLVADSYNDALKWVNLQTREAITWLRGFNEPGGVAITSSHAYVADTNAHRIMVADLSTGSPTELEIV